MRHKILAVSPWALFTLFFTLIWSVCIAGNAQDYHLVEDGWHVLVPCGSLSILSAVGIAGFALYEERNNKPY